MHTISKCGIQKNGKITKCVKRVSAMATVSAEIVSCMRQARRCNGKLETMHLQANMH